jgi:hypothetical protein
MIRLILEVAGKEFRCDAVESVGLAELVDGVAKQAALPWLQEDGYMVQYLGGRASYALPHHATVASLGLSNDSRLLVRQAYDTQELAALYRREGWFQLDMTRAGLPQEALSIDAETKPDEYIREALRLLHRLACTAELVVLAAARWSSLDGSRLPLLKDIASDFPDPSLACPCCWSELSGAHERLRTLWSTLR